MEIIADVLERNGLVFAFVVVGALMWSRTGCPRR